jgi:hypothetical protein
MANHCKNTITLIGLQETPETFVNTLSKEMFGIDLNNPKLEWWGDQNSGVDPQNWYRMPAEEYRNEGCYAARLGVLYIEKPFERLGVTAPRFYVETKWGAPLDELLKTSKVFPELTFHIEWLLLQDGPSGEYVIRNGVIRESVVRRKSWYLFDGLRNPILSLLPAQMPYTLAQRAAWRFEDAVQTLEGICRVLDDQRFTDSPYQSLRNPSRVAKTRKALDAAIEQMEDTARLLDFDGVFLDASQSMEEFARLEHEMAEFDDPQQLGDEILDADAVDEGVEEVDF